MSQTAPNSIPQHPIRKVAKKLDISNPTLHMYERAGLLFPYKKESKHRLYSDEDIRRVEFIVKAIREDGLNLEGLRRLMALLPCWNLKPCTFVDHESCPVLYEYKNPCWMIEKTLCQQDERDCRTCSVYRQSIQKIKQLKEYMKKSK